MISRVSGRLEQVTDKSALVDVGGGVWYELLAPSCDLERLARKVGQDVVLHTIHYVEGNPAHGVQTPRLIGFLCENDREFFRVFTTVKGIGVRKALRAMVRPVGEVAAAIQNKDARFLVALPEIGKRTAEQIIAELHGKVEPFAGAAAPAPQSMSEPAGEAISILVQLGERRADAMALVERVLAVAPEADNPQTIIQHAYRLRSGAV